MKRICNIEFKRYCSSGLGFQTEKDGSRDDEDRKFILQLTVDIQKLLFFLDSSEIFILRPFLNFRFAFLVFRVSRVFRTTSP